MVFMKATTPLNKVDEIRDPHDTITSFFTVFRTLAYVATATILVNLWMVFDGFIDQKNFITFVGLRLAYDVVVITATTIFILAGKPEKHYRKLGMAVYLMLIATILPMIIITESKFAYYLGFSTVFFGTSVIMVWPLRYLMIPMLTCLPILLGLHFMLPHSRSEYIVGTFLIFNVCFSSLLAGWFSYHAYEQINQLITKLNELSVTDKLTGLFNRRYFDMGLDREFAFSARFKTPLSMLLIDIDHFKNYNDNYGHHAGDICLKHVAEALENNLQRKTDFVARYGGEEFVIILTDTREKEAVRVANRIINTIRELKIIHEHSPAAPIVTISIGAATMTATPQDAPQELIVAADKALYMAKNNGRNRVESTPH
jgi:diguanylate cyclase (GGDEF)-like protein